MEKGLGILMVLDEEAGRELRLRPHLGWVENRGKCNGEGMQAEPGNPRMLMPTKRSWEVTKPLSLCSSSLQKH